MVRGDFCAPGGDPQPRHHEETSAGGGQPVADYGWDEIKHARALIQRLAWHARPRAHHQTVADIHANHQDRNTTSHTDANLHPNLHKHRNRHPKPHGHPDQHPNSHGHPDQHPNSRRHAN